jgi:hypothetical protein
LNCLLAGVNPNPHRVANLRAPANVGYDVVNYGRCNIAAAQAGEIVLDKHVIAVPVKGRSRVLPEHAGQNTPPVPAA